MHNELRGIPQAAFDASRRSGGVYCDVVVLSLPKAPAAEQLRARPAEPEERARISALKFWGHANATARALVRVESQLAHSAMMSSASKAARKAKTTGLREDGKRGGSSCDTS